jgi:DNA-binding NarL/FixJ family response regulator
VAEVSATLAVPVMLVDDHRMVVLGLRTLFHNRPEVKVVAYAHDADQALDVCRAEHPRVAVVDIALEGSDVDGFELCRRLRAAEPDVDVVFYTGLDELGVAERAFSAGAKGVVSKGDAAADLVLPMVAPGAGNHRMVLAR